MKDKKINIGVTDVVLLIIEIIFLVGIITVFKACGPMEDGSWMSCHWACQAVTGVAGVLLVISLLHMFIPGAKIKLGLSIAMIPVSILSAIIPGYMIKLCMMDTMRCHAVMRPFVIVISIISIVISIIDIIIQHKKD